MILLTDISFFKKPLEIPNLYESDDVKAEVNRFIRMYEPKLLSDILGYELYKGLQAALLVNPLSQSYQDLLFGKEYTNSYSRLTKWRGLIEIDSTFLNLGSGVVNYKNPEWLEVGVTKDDEDNIIIPVNATAFTMLSWVGWEPIIFRYGAGPMRKGVHYDYDIATGDFQLLQADDAFQQNETLQVMFQIPESYNGVTFVPNSSQAVEYKDTVEWTAGVDLMEDGVTVYPFGVSSFTNPDWKGWQVMQFTQFGSIYKKGRDYSYNPTIGTLTKLNEGDVFEPNADYQLSFKPRVTGSILQGEADTTSYKHSLIADYVYFYWQRDRASFTTGIGEKKAQSSSTADVSPAQKQVSAWNDMSEWIGELHEYLECNKSVYPTWYGRTYGVCNKYRKINVFGI